MNDRPRPADRSIAAKIIADQALGGYLEYGLASGIYGQRTLETGLPAGQPVEIEITGLQPDTEYFYRLRYRRSGESTFATDEEYSFRTQRAPGSTFIFDIQAVRVNSLK